jgi:hypothetical protein
MHELLLINGGRVAAAGGATLMTAEIGATAAWSRFNISMASAMLLEAAAQVYNVRGRPSPATFPVRRRCACRRRGAVPRWTTVQHQQREFHI